MWIRVFWIATVAACLLSRIHITRGLEGSLFYLTFMRNDNQRDVLQEIFVTSSTDAEVKIEYNFPILYTETIFLNLSNNWTYAARIETADADFCPPFNVTTNAAIVISSDTNISVQANSGKSGSGDGYLGLPLTSSSTKFYLALYDDYSGMREYSIVTPYDNTSVLVARMSRSTVKDILKLKMSKNDVYHCGTARPPDYMYDGLFVTSSKPIAVYAGHSCAKIPDGTYACDHIIEQMPPISQWGKTFIMASFYGRDYKAGFIIRVIAQNSTNVTYWSQTYDSNNDPLDYTLFRSVTLDNGRWDEADISSTSNIVVVLVNCSLDCLVMQYNKGNGAGDESDIGEPDPFMMTVPSLDHYTNNIRFSTSRYKKLDELKEYDNGITIIAKMTELHKVYLDNSSVANITDGMQYTIKISEWTSYTAVIAPLDPGFHSVYADDPDIIYAVFVYGHTEDVASYGYLGGYRYIYGDNDQPIMPSDDFADTKQFTASSYTSLVASFADVCSSSPCLNGGTCDSQGDSFVCDCGSYFSGPLCEADLYAGNCGDLLHSTHHLPVEGWSKLCEISTNDTALVDTPCYDLLQGLPVYENATGLLQAGGNFGCWLSSEYPENIKQACYDDLQHYHTLSSCLDCLHLVVCMRYPAE